MSDPTHLPADPARRAFVLAMGAAMAACQTPPAAAAPLCPTDPTISNPAAPLTIDTHAHFFNGRDLQIREFLSQTTVGPDSELYPLVESIGGLLQSLAWHKAPDASSELSAIGRYATAMKNCGDEAPMRRAAAGAYQEGYALGRQQLREAAQVLAGRPDGAAVLGPSDQLSGLGAAIDDLPPTIEEFEVRRADSAAVLGSQPTLAGYLQFVLHHFNYRHVNAIDYLQTYSKGSARKVDLVVASLVDYDWWLAKGQATPTSLTEQIALMSQVSLLLGGRVHGFAPFCPFREVMTRDASGTGDAMRLVRRAIETQGCIGVKLYPPMGFAAQGNAGRSVWQGKPTLHEAAHAPEFGKRLDSAMASLFDYCVTNDVPVMAHTNHSNGPYESFKDLAGSEGWELALQRFPGLGVSFGHFGDSDPEDHKGEKTRRFLALMTASAQSPGGQAFADSGYFAGALMNQVKMRDVLRSLYATPPNLLRERLMYGSDWTMILTQKNVERYLSDFMQVMGRIEELEPGQRVRGTTLSDAFFGRNATEYLGLRAGRGNRRRLEAFYTRNSLPTPDWMRKVDVV